MANVVIDGVGREAEIVTNKNGGKQSKSPVAMHLIDPEFLSDFANNEQVELERAEKKDSEQYACYSAIEFIGFTMKFNNKHYLKIAMEKLEPNAEQRLLRIAKVLEIGASRYAVNNWRLIPEEEHLNHALIHIVAHIAGDTQDEHLDHALCRLMMACATEKSEGFSYGEYVQPVND